MSAINRSGRAARRRANRLAWERGEKLQCGWCRRNLRYRDSTADHIIPVRMGGRARITSERSNLMTSCERCNDLRAVEAHILFGEWNDGQGILRKWQLLPRKEKRNAEHQR